MKKGYWDHKCINPGNTKCWATLNNGTDRICFHSDATRNFCPMPFVETQNINKKLKNENFILPENFKIYVDDSNRKQVFNKISEIYKSKEEFEHLKNNNNVSMFIIRKKDNSILWCQDKCIDNSCGNIHVCNTYILQKIEVDNFLNYKSKLDNIENLLNSKFYIIVNNIDEEHKVLEKFEKLGILWLSGAKPTFFKPTLHYGILYYLIYNFSNNKCLSYGSIK